MLAKTLHLVSVGAALATASLASPIHEPWRGLQSSNNNPSSINSILGNLSLSLPDQSVSVDTFLGSLNVEITNLSCDDLTARNVTVDHKVVNGTVQRLTLDASGLGATCSFDWTYAVSFFSGSGAGTGYLDPTSFIKVAYDFVSKDFAEYPPTSVVMSNCATDLQIQDLELDGNGLGVISSIVELFKSSIADLVEGELDGAVCADVLGSEVLNKLNEVILSVNGRLEPYLDQESNAQNPLYLENTIEVPTNSDGKEIYVDFQQTKWFDQIQKYIVDNVNTLINDAFLSNDGVLEVDTSLLDNARLQADSSFINRTNVTITSLTILGLDSLYGVELLVPIGKYTLQNSFKWKELTFILEMEATHDPSEIADVIVQKPDTPPVTDSFTMEMTVKDIAVDLSVLLGINIETLGDVALGSILYIDNILPCVRSAVEQSAVTQLLVEVSQVSPPKITGFLDDQMNTVINTATDAFFYMYQSVLLQALPSFFGTVVKDMINDKISEVEDSSCPEPNSSLNGVVDFRDLLLSESQAVEMGGTGGSPYGDLLQAVYGALVDIMSASDENGLSEMNQVVSSMTKNQSGVEGELYWDGYLFKQSMTVDLNGLNAAISVAVSDLKVSNLDTMGAPIEMFAPVYGEGSNLNNSASIGVGQDSLRASLKLHIFGEGDQTTVDNDIELGISLSGLRMILEFIARMEEPPFLNFPMRDIFNLNCWMATIVTPELDQYGLRIGEVTMGVEDMAMIVEEAKFDMSCISCSSPVLLDMESYFSSEEGIADSTTTVNKILDTLSRFMEGEYVQNRIDKMLSQAPYRCPHNPEYDQDFAGIEYEDLVPPEKDEGAIGFLIAIIVVVICVIVLSTLAVIVTRFITRRRHDRWLKQLNETQIQILAEEEQYETERQKDLNKRMKSLVCSQEVPLLFKIGIPITIFGNIALFLSGHLSLGGTVNISGSFAGQGFNVEGFFEFSMVKSTIDMWLAGAKELAILIAIFSGLWPYTKQLMSLFLWFVKPSLVSSKRRGSVLHWLDLLGKWSMVDVFVLLTTLASFRITIESPSNVKYLPEGLYEVNMLVVPLWGLYANMLAQLVSQISSHIIIHYHKKTIQAATRAQEEEWGILTDELTNEPGMLRKHCFMLDYEASSKRAIVNDWVNWVLLTVLVSLAVLVTLGCTLPSFSIEILGLLGLAVESGNEFEQAKTYYSVFSLAQLIMDEARYLGDTSSYLGLGTLASLLVLTVFIVPFGQTASLLVEWFVAISPKRRYLNGIVNEILSAWQYMEVFVLSVIITSWQLAGVSDFMVNAYCGELDGIFTTLAYFGIVDVNDAQCFQLRAGVESASWLLVTASIILAVSSHVVLTASTQKVLDENVPPNRRLHTDRWSSKESAEVAFYNHPNNQVVSEGKTQRTQEKSKVSPIPPRFTDYYSFATRIEDVIDERIEPAHESEINSNEETCCVISTNQVEPKDNVNHNYIDLGPDEDRKNQEQNDSCTVEIQKEAEGSV